MICTPNGRKITLKNGTHWWPHANITEEKAVINVGSVGQPRDHDPRSSFVILHPGHVEFIRMAYDINTTVDKVRSIDALDNFLGQRLLEGA